MKMFETTGSLGKLSEGKSDSPFANPGGHLLVAAGRHSDSVECSRRCCHLTTRDYRCKKGTTSPKSRGMEVRSDAKYTSTPQSHGKTSGGSYLSLPPDRNREGPHTRLISPKFASVCVRKAFMHTWFSPCSPFQISADPPVTYGIVSLNVTPGRKHDFGRTLCAHETSRRTFKHLFFRFGFTEGTNTTLSARNLGHGKELGERGVPC
jgi:hypothetical protein